MMVELNRAIFFFDDDDDDDDGLLLFQIEQKAYGYQTLDQLYVSGTTEKLEINLLYYHQSLIGYKFFLSPLN